MNFKSLIYFVSFVTLCVCAKAGDIGSSWLSNLAPLKKFYLNEALQYAKGNLDKGLIPGALVVDVEGGSLSPFVTFTKSGKVFASFILKYQKPFEIVELKKFDKGARVPFDVIVYSPHGQMRLSSQLERTGNRVTSIPVIVIYQKELLLLNYNLGSDTLTGPLY